MTSAKLKAARDRKRATTGVKVGGRASHAEERPETVAMARHLRDRNLSLRAIAAALEGAEHRNQHGRRFSAAAVKSMLDREHEGDGRART